jgi:hypothetical protein
MGDEKRDDKAHTAECCCKCGETTRAMVVSGKRILCAACFDFDRMPTVPKGELHD